MPLKVPAYFLLLAFAFATYARDQSADSFASGQISDDDADPTAGDRASEISICDKYSAKLFDGNTVLTQKALMVVYVNTAMSGNYSVINTGIAVPGVTKPSFFKGRPINQRPWFNGELNSTNVTPDMGHGFPVNWLDGGGTAALHSNVPASNVDSNQFFYFNHLYQYFAYLLGCSIYGNLTERYKGNTDMYHVHKYMGINNDMQQYTILQFVLSAASLGFAKDAQAQIGHELNHLFSFRCSPPKSIPEWAPPAPQTMCTRPDCPIYKGNRDCPEEDSLPLPDPVLPPDVSAIRVYSSTNDTDDIDST